MDLSMTNALEQAVEKALHSKGDNVLSNKAYLEFMKANFIIPIEKTNDLQPAFPQENGEIKPIDEPRVLYLEEKNQTFLPVFSSIEYLDAWAIEIRDHIHLLKLSGVDLLKGIGENVTVAFNPGSAIYKEFNTAEIDRKSVV